VSIFQRRTYTGETANGFISSPKAKTAIHMNTRSRSVSLGLLTLAFATSSAFAQTNAPMRQSQGEFYILIQDWSSESVTIGGVTLPTNPGPNPLPVTSDLRFNFKDEVFWGFGGAYHMNDRWAIRGELAFGSPSYEMTWNNAKITGESWINHGKLNLDFNLLKNLPFTPFISGGIGYLYIDTGIPNGPPQYTVWWDYYWGPVAYGTQPTYQKTYFTYNGMLGFRWDIGDRFAMRASYASNWVDTRHDTLRTNELTFSFSWKY